MLDKPDRKVGLILRDHGDLYKEIKEALSKGKRVFIRGLKRGPTNGTTQQSEAS